MLFWSGVMLCVEAQLLLQLEKWESSQIDEIRAACRNTFEMQKSAIIFSS